MQKNGQVIVLTDKNGNHEAWGSLVELCKEHVLSHNYLKKKKYPFDYRGVKFERLKFRQKPDVGHVTFEVKK